jgi:nucleotide-binding universal stress UspA family protein
VHFRRILVALDATAASAAALDAAATLAARMDADLSGLFVEDLNLLRLADLPFASELDLVSGNVRRLAAPDMALRLRAQAERARTLLARAAGRRGRSWAFRVARGHVATELVTAAIDVDLIALGTGTARLVRARRVGSTAQAVMARAAGSLLLVPQGAHVMPRVAALFDDSPSADRTLRLAATLASYADGELTVLIPMADAARVRHLRESVAVRLAIPEATLRCHTINASAAGQLGTLMRTERIGTLVLAVDTDALDAGSVGALLEGTECAVLLVR